MTVVFLGIGADSTNATPTPPVDASGRFEYIPIPESEPTTESKTYGTVSLRHRPGTMATYLDAIDPRGDGTHTIQGTELANWPLHHDPNFEALTFGESPSRPAYTARLGELTSGDLLAFYTGLSDPADQYRHRYLIGTMTVQSLTEVTEPDHAAEYHAQLPENAHVKRHMATGEMAPGTVLVNGTTPGGRYDRAIRISTHHGRGHHYLTDRLQQQLQPRPGGNPDRNAYLGGVKKAHLLTVSPDRFRAIIDRERERQGL